MDDLDAKLTLLEARVDGLIDSTAPKHALQALSDRIDRLEARLADQTALARRLAAIEDQLSRGGGAG